METNMTADKKPKKNPLSLQLDPDLFERASDEEKAQIVTQRESVSFMKDAMRRFVKNKMAMTCLIILILITLIAIFVPMFYPYNYTQQDVTAKYLQPFEYSKKEMARIKRRAEILEKLEKQTKLFQDSDIRVLYEPEVYYGPGLPF